MKHITALAFAFSLTTAMAQVINTATMDTADYQLKGRLTVEGYLDLYYAYNFNKPVSKDQPYLVSMSRHNETNVNLAFVDLKYSSSRVRARVAPGFGTYMNANYANEQGTLKHFVEANAGYKIWKRKNIWIDAGVLGSPYTNESAISKDHLAYTRSLSAENVPYYLSGVKLSMPLSRNVNAFVYILNGWQQIIDQNEGKSIGTQFEWRPNKNLLVNWNTYLGNDRSAIDSAQGLRTFSDIFLIYTKQKWSITSCVYGGRQKTTEETRAWWQANLIARYAINTMLSITGRVEYFKDTEGAIVIPITNETGFTTFGSSLGINVTPDSNLQFRAELRHFVSNKSVYQRESTTRNASTTITVGACVWF
jgi:hypothetical protein